MSPEPTPIAKTAADGQTLPIKGRLERRLDNVDKALASGGNLFLDFHECTFITVDGLEWLEELLLRAESVGSTVRFVRVPTAQYKVFKVAHIQSLLKACGSPPAGIAPVC
jgi:MFS superfamily sulfate permease-like transporter